MLTSRQLASFWKRVRKADGCWEWIGPRNALGYGYCTLTHSHTLRAHRVSWEIAHGQPVPEDMNVCHHCDNPPCVRPDHLFLGTHADNVADKIAKGRARWGTLKGESKPQAKLTGTQVAEIRALRKTGAQYAAILERYPISRSQLINILSRRQWKEIADAVA